MSPLRRFLVTGAAWAGAGTVARMPLALLLNAAAARLLIPADFGIFLLSVSVMQVGATLCAAGLPPLVTRALAGSDDGSLQQAVTRLRTSLTVGVGAWALLTLALAWPGRMLAGRLGLAALAAILPLVSPMVLGRVLEMLVAESFRGRSNIRAATFYGGFWTHFSTAVAFVALWAADVEVTIGQAVGLYGALMLVGVLVGLVRLVRDLPHSLLRGRREPVPSLLLESGPVLVHTMMFIVLRQADLWIVAALMTADDAALYGAALRVVLLIGVPINIANQIVPPLVARMYAEGEVRRLERILRSVATLTGLPAALGLLGIAVVSGPVMAIGFGEFYRAAGPLVVVLGLGTLASVLAGSCEVALVQTGHQREMSLSSLAGGVVLVVGAVAGASRGSMLTVAAAGAAGLIVQNVLMVVWARRLVGIRTYVAPRIGWSALRELRSPSPRAVPAEPGG